MSDIVVRSDLRPGDIGYLLQRHGVLYAAEFGFDPSFEGYVAEPLGKFVRTRTTREQLWIAEADGRAIGWVAIVRADDTTAQLRWFLVEPEMRGRGLGKRLLGEAIRFCLEAAYARVILWTVPQLTAAARLYVAAGFAMVEEKVGGHCGALTREWRYELPLTAG